MLRYCYNSVSVFSSLAQVAVWVDTGPFSMLGLGHGPEREQARCVKIHLLECSTERK